jgi:hypothetical protein
MTPDSTDRPNLFSLLARGVVGELGEGTEIESGKECEVCHRVPPPAYGHIEYAFDRWNGEDLVTAMRVLCVSDRLRRALEAAALTGVEFEPATTSRNDGFSLGPRAYAKAVPKFFHLRVNGMAEGPETWAAGKRCEACGVTSMRPTRLGLEALATRDGETMPLREVYADSWKGEDIFNLPDRLRHVVTSRFRTVLDAVNPADASYGPAVWVER